MERLTIFSKNISEDLLKLNTYIYIACERERVSGHTIVTKFNKIR